ncbi:MAG: hypothetical protein KAR11_07935 [Phycisphaerae bacterium]|nr:hypothetical protein [Phycisphaerae bacterium]
MKRKLALMITSFVLLLLGLTTYQFFVPSLQIFNSATNFRHDVKSFGQGGEKLTFIDYDKEGAKRGVFTAHSWTKHDDGTLDLFYPTAVLYQKDGTRTYLKAAQGHIIAEQVAGGFNVSEGTLTGNVVIYFDQLQGEDDVLHPDKRTYQDVTRDCIRIVANEIKFTRDMLQIETKPDTEISLWSRTVDLVGVGLKLRWNESPRELRLLEIAKMKSMLIKELPEEMDMMQLPGQTKSENPAPGPVVVTATVPAAESKPVVVTTLAVEAPVEIPGRTPKKKKSVTLVKKDSTPRTTVVRGDRGESEGRNVYEATFYEDVTVDSGNRRLSGADILAMTFEWDTAWRADSDDSEPPAPVAAKPVAAAPKKDTKDDPAVTAATAPAAPSATSAPAAAPSAVTSKPTPTVAPANQEKVEIHCRGKLIIKPIGKTKHPSRKRYTVAGKGARVLLTEPQACIVCTDFNFKSPAQEATFIGTVKDPVRLLLSRGEEITTKDTMRFNRTDNKGYLDGPGTILRFADAPEVATGKNEWDRLIIENDDSRPISERVIWSKSVEITLTDYQAYEDGKPLVNAKGKPTLQPGIKDATFKGDVKLTQKTTPDKAKPDVHELNKLSCDNLKVAMKTELGENYLDKVTAIGNVVGIQGGNKLNGDETIIGFRPKKATATEKPPAADGLAGGLETASVEPCEITVKGHVDVTYPNPDTPKDAPLRITGDYLNAIMTSTTTSEEEANQLGVVTGRPAKVWQGDNAIEADKIYFDQLNEGVLVEGAGKLLFKAPQKDKSGKITSYRPIVMSWAKKMRYHGKPSGSSGGYGIFDGDVEMRTDKKITDINGAGELVRAGNVRVFLRKPDKKSGEQGGKGNPMRVGIDDFGAKVYQIEASGGKGDSKLAVLQMQRQNPKNEAWVLQRQELRAEDFRYNLENENAFVDGAGKFLAEDYSPPKDKKPSRDDGMTLRSPSQTIVSWTKSMKVDQQAGHLAVKGKVEMHNYTGNKLRNSPDIKFAPLGRLSFGRINTLRADTMNAWFDKPDAPVKKTAPEDTGTLGAMDMTSEFGALRLFKAMHNVTFTDSEKENVTRIISGQQIVYEGPKNLVTVFGYLEGQKKTDATVTMENLNDRTSSVMSSPALKYNMKTGKVETESIDARGVTAGGGGE